MKSKLGRKTWLAVVLFSLCGQVAWTIENMLFNVFIQEEFNATLDQVALMVSLSAVAATVTTLFMGALSDKIAKRKIFIVGGYILWGLSIMAFALLKVENLELIAQGVNALALGVGLTITFDCLMTFFGSTANDAAFNAWLTDTTDSNNRGHVEGVNSAMPLIAVLVVFGGKMLVDSNDNKWTIIFLAIGILVLLVGILGIFIIKEPQLEKKNDSYFKNIFYGFRPSVMKENSILYILFVGMMVFSISIQVFMPYLIIYFERTIELTNYVFVFAPAIIVAAIFTVFYGRFIEKLGFLKASLLSLGLYLFGLLFLTISPNVVIVFIGTLTMMMGYLSLSAVFNTKIRDYTPTEKTGLFQGVRIFTAVLVPMLIGPWIGSMISGSSGDFGFGVVAPGYIPSNLMFVGALGVGLLSIPFIIITSTVMKKRKVDDFCVKLPNDDTASKSV